MEERKMMWYYVDLQSFQVEASSQEEARQKAETIIKEGYIPAIDSLGLMEE